MLRSLLVFASMASAIPASAQSPFPTEFPPDSAPVDSGALKLLLTGKTFLAKPTEGQPYRIQYKETYVFFNSGSFRDTGRWRTEGSSVCIEWNNIRPSCSEIRISGSIPYVKRANNGEVVRMEEQ